MRRVPSQFSWIDQALVQRNLIDRCDARAAALYLFLVTVADVPIFNIGAAFWGLVFGFATSWLLERKEFDK